MQLIDDTFHTNTFHTNIEVARQLFLVVDTDLSGFIEISEFMHLFRNINQVGGSPLLKLLNIWPLT
jgi:hypothetical protein